MNQRPLVLVAYAVLNDGTLLKDMGNIRNVTPESILKADLVIVDKAGDLEIYKSRWDTNSPGGHVLTAEEAMTTVIGHVILAQGFKRHG